MINSIQNRPTNNWAVWALSFLTIIFVPHLTYAVGVPGPDLSVTSVSGAAGSTVTVSVIGDFPVAANSSQFNLTFDPNLLTVSSVTAGSASSSWVVVNNPNTPGTLIVGMFNTGGSASSISGSQQQIAVIKFTVNTPPSGYSTTISALTLSSVDFDSTSVSALTAGTFTLNVPLVDYGLTVNISGTGSVTESVGGTTTEATSFPSGTVVQLTPVPGSGYQFSGWSSGASGSANPLNVTMSGDTTILANFTLIPPTVYTITASAGTGGTISPSGSVSVNSGANKLFTVTPNAGYNAALTVDGSLATLTNNTYTFSNVTANHTIAVSFSLQTNTVTASAGSNGTISPSGSVSVNYGGSQLFTVTPNTGYNAALTVDGSAVTLTNNTYTLSNVTTTHTVAASFSLQTKTINANAGANGSITPSGSVIVNYGASQLFTVTPNTGYNVTLMVDGSAATLTNNTYTFSNVTTTHTISVSFSLQTENITASAGTGGTISPSGSVSVNYGASQKFTVTPNTGYNINQVLVDGAAVTLASDNSYTLTNVTAVHTISASFTLQTKTITASAGANGSITPSGSVILNYGASQLFTVTPDAHYNASLTVDGAAVTLTNNTYTLSNITAAHTVAASFSLVTNAITASAGIGGTISPSGAVSVSYGVNQKFTVTPNTGYNINQVLVDGSAVTLASDNSYTLSNVITTHTIAASFTLQTNTVTASAGANGSISPSGSINVNYGASQLFTFTPATGYTTILTVDGVPVTLTNNTYTLSDVTATHTLVSSFALQIETITSSAGTGGNISPSGTVNLNYGASRAFTVTPNSGFIIDQVLVDGSAVTLPSTNIYTFSNVTAAHTISASFSQSVEVAPSFTIKARSGVHGTINPSGEVSVNYGAEQIFTVTPDTGYDAVLTVDGSPAELTDNTYTFSNVTVNHTIDVRYTKQTETITASSGKNGTIDPSGSIDVNYGANKTFTVKPNTGYTAKLTVDGIAVVMTNNRYTLSDVTTSHTVVASFILKTEIITASAEKNGTISPSGAVNVNYGTNKTFTVTADTGYTATLKVDGAVVKLTNNTYTLSDVTKAHTLKASFKLTSVKG